MGVTTTHFPSGDRIISRLHSIFILVHILLHFSLMRIDFDHSPSSFGGVTITHFPGGDHVGFSLELLFVPCFGSTSTIYLLGLQSFTGWCSTSRWEPHDCSRPFVFQFPVRTAHGHSRLLVFVFPMRMENEFVFWGRSVIHKFSQNQCKELGTLCDAQRFLIRVLDTSFWSSWCLPMPVV